MVYVLETDDGLSYELSFPGNWTNGMLEDLKTGMIIEIIPDPEFSFPDQASLAVHNFTVLEYAVDKVSLSSCHVGHIYGCYMSIKVGASQCATAISLTCAC